MALCHDLVRRGDGVLAVDLLESPGLVALSRRYPDLASFRHAEITEWALLAGCFANFQPDAVVHCAAVVGVTNSISAPLNTIRTNVEGSLNVFNLAQNYGVRRVVNLSTEEVYGPFESDLIDEGHPCRPLKPYGISKYAVECLSLDFTDTDIIHLRLSWAYGPGLPRPRIPKTLVDAAMNGSPLHLESGADFRVDHTYIDDAVAGLVCALDADTHEHDVYNIGSGTSPSLGEIAAIVSEIVPGSDISVGPGHYEFAPGLPVVPKGALDVTRAATELGYQPKFDIRKGLEEYVRARRVEMNSPD